MLFASGATWWKFSTDADSYVLSVLLLLLAISFVLRDRPSFLLAGICHSLAMLFHELAVFAYIPMMAAILWEVGSPFVRIRRACGYLLGSAGSVAFVYRLAYSFVGWNSSRTFLRWITSFSTESRITRSWRQILIAYPASYLKLLGGGRLSLIREYLSLPVIIALLFSLAALLAGIWLLRRPEGKFSSPASSRTQAELWAWILPYLVFLAWWEPGSAFYKLFIWPPLVLLLGCFIAERSSWMSRSKALVAFSAALAAWNFGAFIFPHSHSSADPVLALAEKINRELPRDATVYNKVLSPDDWYLQYFAPDRRWLPLPADGKSLPQTGFEPICFETTAFAFANNQISPRREWRLVNGKHYVRLVCR